MCMQSLPSRQAGFGLIELIIVIAVLGILATLVLTAVSSSRIRAYDSRIRSGVGQIRWMTESVYDTQGASYLNWTQVPSIATNLNIILEDIDRNYGDTAGSPFVTVLRESQTNEYCVSAPLRSQPGKYYCIDATAVFRTTSSACPDYAQGEDPLRCPGT